MGLGLIMSHGRARLHTGILLFGFRLHGTCVNRVPWEDGRTGLHKGRCQFSSLDFVGLKLYLPYRNNVYKINPCLLLSGWLVCILSALWLVLCLGEREQRGRAATEDSQKNQQHSYTRKPTLDIFSFKIILCFFLSTVLHRLKKSDAIGQPGTQVSTTIYPLQRPPNWLI